MQENVELAKSRTEGDTADCYVTDGPKIVLGDYLLFINYGDVVKAGFF